MQDRPEPRTIYGRQQSRPLSPTKRALLERHLPSLLIQPHIDAKNSLEKIFAGTVQEVWLEIGFGGGEHLLSQAKAHPNIGIIGCEPFLNGLANAVSAIEEQGLENIRLHNGDAREVLEFLPDESISRIFLLFPDPWPKKRHHKRRFVNPHNLGHIARILKKDGTFRVASDIKDYVDWTLKHIRKNAVFHLKAERAEDWRIRADDWPPTRYEAKAIREGRKPAYMSFEKSAKC